MVVGHVRTCVAVRAVDQFVAVAAVLLLGHHACTKEDVPVFLGCLAAGDRARTAVVAAAVVVLAVAGCGGSGAVGVVHTVAEVVAGMVAGE